MTRTNHSTQLPGETPADACRRHGWRVGDQLVGDEGNGPTVIRITAIGEQAILAVAESHNSVPDDPAHENSWTLAHRTWTRLPRPSCTCPDSGTGPWDPDWDGTSTLNNDCHWHGQPTAGKDHR